jgi:hypothetical protein
MIPYKIGIFFGVFWESKLATTVGKMKQDPREKKIF